MAVQVVLLLCPLSSSALHTFAPSLEAAQETGPACAGFAIASGIAIPSGSGIMTKLHGPLIILFGIAVALVGGVLCRFVRPALHPAPLGRHDQPAGPAAL